MQSERLVVHKRIRLLTVVVALSKRLAKGESSSATLATVFLSSVPASSQTDLFHSLQISSPMQQSSRERTLVQRWRDWRREGRCRFRPGRAGIGAEAERSTGKRRGSHCRSRCRDGYDRRSWHRADQAGVESVNWSCSVGVRVRYVRGF